MDHILFPIVVITYTILYLKIAFSPFKYREHYKGSKDARLSDHKIPFGILTL